MSARTPVVGSLSLAVVMTLVAVQRLSSQNVLGECGLTFDDTAVLAALPNQAGDTFAPNYRMGCSPHFLNVEPLGEWSHFHLSFEDPSITCLDFENTGLFGREVNGECVPADWDHEPRKLQSHVQQHWIKIWMEDSSSHQPRPFDLRRIHIGQGPPIQLWYRTQSGVWWFWNQLGNDNWNVEQWSKKVMEVRVRGTNSGGGPYTILNAYVRN